MNTTASGILQEQRRSRRAAVKPGAVITLQPHPDLSPEVDLTPDGPSITGILIDQAMEGCGVLCVSDADWVVGQYWFLSDGAELVRLARVIWVKMLDNHVLRLGFSYCEENVAAIDRLVPPSPPISNPDQNQGRSDTQSGFSPEFQAQPQADSRPAFQSAPGLEFQSEPRSDLQPDLQAAARPAFQPESSPNPPLESHPKPDPTSCPEPPADSPSPPQPSLHRITSTPLRAESADYSCFTPNLDQILQTCPLFEGIDPQLLRSILPHCTCRSFQAGETLIHAGYHNHHLHLLLSGYLRVSLMNLPNSYFNQDLGLTITPGECIGEMSMIESRPVCTYVVAETDGQLLQIPASVFWEHLIHVPRLTQNLLKELSNRIRRSDAIILSDLEHRLQFEQIEKDLEFASEIQANILPCFPALPHHPQVDVFAQVQPAREVGGDFFDVFELDQRYVCVAVGDVSGKGIPAALFMIRSITLLRLMISPAKSLDAALAQINEHLCRNNENSMFLTLFVGILDTESGQLTYVNGGHIPPLLQAQGQAWQPLALPSGVLLGIDASCRYELATLWLQPGDALVAYTDGITEAENHRQEFFGVERAIRVLEQLPKGAGAAAIVGGLKAAVADFTGKTAPSDDLTLLALRYTAFEDPWLDPA